MQHPQRPLKGMVPEALERGDRALESVAKGHTDQAVHDLLAAFFRGYPVERLRPLLLSSDEAIAKTATWILSELGANAAPLLDTFATPLNHPARYVRAHALDAVLVCTTPRDGALLATAVALLNDHDEAVCWKALGFIAHASTAQLVSSISPQPNQQLAVLTRWVVALDSDPNAAERIIQALTSTDPLERRFAVAGARRIAINDPGPITHALQSHHTDIASFAAEQSRHHNFAG